MPRERIAKHLSGRAPTDGGRLPLRREAADAEGNCRRGGICDNLAGKDLHNYLYIR